MEFAAKPAKPISNISEVVSNFARVCRLRSIGVLSSENPSQSANDGIDLLLAEDSCDATEEAEFDIQKVHPQPVEVPMKSKECSKLDVLTLFDAISVLKLAYVQLQEAHVPYDTVKIKAADELVVSQLEALCKIKHARKEKQFEKPNPTAARSALLLAEIQVQERLLKKLKSHIKPKEAEVNGLQRELWDLNSRNDKLAEELRQREKSNARFSNFFAIQNTSKAVSEAIHDFAKPLIALMKVSGWDLDRASKAIEDSIVYSKRSHKKYAFEAYITRRMFYGITPKSYNVDDIMRFDDPVDALTENPNSDFAKFCRTKYLLVVHPKMEASFFGNLDHRKFVSSGRHPRTLFYQAFAKMARWVWVLQGTVASIGSKVEIFKVKRGSEFSDVFMECVEQHMEDVIGFDEDQLRFRVEFMVMPGIRIGETLVKSRVYLSKVRSSIGTC
ncbi:hypothetical protein RJ639_043284 [Escallonia herrerae]|uniref:DUF641 domain-containing protein n=1 Tax=Escallonia herrerae TaxID=1293975 RepID=A0AA88WKN7_9ASTE|nr:hypothetical protein RJ639_043284 [Escallonia herrerae]